MSYIIYRITNKINNKHYIGRTTQSLEKRWSIHKSHAKYWNKYFSRTKSSLYASINKHGIDNFYIEQIDEVSDFSALVKLESFYIKKYHSHNSKFGYNLIIDTYGDGLEFLSDVSKEKISMNNNIKKTRGITWDKIRKKWALSFHYLNKFKIRKRFDREEDAKIYRDKLCLYFFKNKAKLFFESNRTKYLNENLKEFCETLTNSKKQVNNKYKGISRSKNGFLLRIGSNRRTYFGWYKTEEEAKQQKDNIEYYLSFRISPILVPDYNKYLAGKFLYQFYMNPQHKFMRNMKQPKKSIYNGVTKYSTYLWEASITHMGKRWRKRFASELAAAQAYNKKIIALNLPKERLNQI